MPISEFARVNYDRAMSELFSNWSGLVQSRPNEVRSVSSIAETREAIYAANAAGWSIRTAGTTHSHSALVHADDGLVLLTDALSSKPEVCAGTGTARVMAGNKLFSIGETLWDAGFSLANQGDIDVQSIGGLIGTGVHGTGRALRSISDSVVAATLLTASGELVDTNQEPELLEALRLNLGAFGVVVDATLSLVPAFHLHERSWCEPIEPVMERIDELTSATRHFEFFWRPESDEAFAKALHPSVGPVDRMVEKEGEYVDRAYVVLPTKRDNKHTEMEYSVPAEHGPACFMKLRKLMQTRFPEVLWPVEYRTLAADNGWISTARGRATVTISIHQAVDLPHEEFFRTSEALFREHQGRPHWGKVHYLGAKELAAEHPETWDRFWTVQRRFDPKGRFLNPHLRHISGL